MDACPTPALGGYRHRGSVLSFVALTADYQSASTSARLVDPNKSVSGARIAGSAHYVAQLERQVRPIASFLLTGRKPQCDDLSVFNEFTTEGKVRLHIA